MKRRSYSLYSESGRQSTGILSRPIGANERWGLERYTHLYSLIIANTYGPPWALMESSSRRRLQLSLKVHLKLSAVWTFPIWFWVLLPHWDINRQLCIGSLEQPRVWPLTPTVDSASSVFPDLTPLSTLGAFPSFKFLLAPQPIDTWDLVDSSVLMGEGRCTEKWSE